MHGVTTAYQEKVPLPELDRFFRALTEVADGYKWALVPHETRFLIRAKVDGQMLCPIMVVGYHKSGKSAKDREVPSTRHMAGQANLSHAGGACIVHNADEIETSRYYRPELRERLLRTVGLVKKVEEPPTTVENVSVN